MLNTHMRRARMVVAAASVAGKSLRSAGRLGRRTCRRLASCTAPCREKPETPRAQLGTFPWKPKGSTAIQRGSLNAEIVEVSTNTTLPILMPEILWKN